SGSLVMLKERQAGPHTRPAFRHPYNLAGPTQFCRALAQREQSYPCTIALRQPDAIIADLYVQHFLLAREADTTPVSLCMAHHVGKGFLHDTVGGDLDGGGKRRQLIGCHHVYTEPLYAVTLYR